MFNQINLEAKWINGCRKNKLTTQYGSIKYYSVAGPIPPRLIVTLQPQSIRYVEILSDDLPVSPHRDHGISVALNFYIVSGDAVTQFWEPSPSATPQQLKDYPNITNSYDTKDLSKADSFVAHAGDVYLLDVQKIHSVNQLIGDRQFIQFSWSNKSFDEILDKLSRLI